MTEGEPDIPKKPKKAVAAATNGESKTNGHAQVEAPKGLKRSNDDGEEQPSKKAKLAGPAQADDVVLVEDAGGAIVIDD